MEPTFVEIDGCMPCFFIRSFTNNNERAKQYFVFAAKSDKYSEALIIRKLVLSDNPKLYSGNGKILKQFKEYYLFEQIFSIKMETLKTVMSVLNDLQPINMHING